MHPMWAWDFFKLRTNREVFKYYGVKVYYTLENCKNLTVLMKRTLEDDWQKNRIFRSHLTQIGIFCTRVITKTRTRSDFFASDLSHFQMWILIIYTFDIWTYDLRLNTHIQSSTIPNARVTRFLITIFLWRFNKGVLTIYPTRQIFLPRLTAHINIASFFSCWTTIFNVSALL